MKLIDQDCRLCGLGGVAVKVTPWAHGKPREEEEREARTCISGRGNSKPGVRVVVVGDAPSRDEVLTRRPSRDNRGFVLGKSYSDDRAELLMKTMEAAGFSLGSDGDVWFTYALKCYPHGNIKIKDVHTCVDARLKKELDHLKPSLIICLGKSAQVAVLKLSSPISKTHGRMYEYEGDGWSCKVMPIEHPFSVISSPGKISTWKADIRRAYSTLFEGDSPFWGEDKLSRFNFVEIKSIQQMRDIGKELVEKYRGGYLAVDVEASGLDDDIFRGDFKMYTVQFGVVDLEDKDENYTKAVYILPFMSEHFPICRKEGWRKNAVTFLNKLLGRGYFDIVAHNGKYDSKVLRRFGIDTYIKRDTMVMWANTHGEASMSLKDISYEVTDLGGYDAGMAAYFKEHKTFDAPPELLLPYGGMDIVATRHLMFDLMKDEKRAMKKWKGNSHG